MDHPDHVALLREAVGARPPDRPVAWADLGAGTGAFTLALAELLGPGSTIVSVDRDAAALEVLAATVSSTFPGVRVETRVGDFRSSLELPTLDGLVMANSLHFVPREHQVVVVRRLADALRPGGRFVVVEYDAERGNPWVPHPFGPATWARMAEEAGLAGTRETGRVPSRTLDAIWSGVSFRPPPPDAG